MQDAPEEYILGVVPFLPPERLELTFGHMAARFAEALGATVRFRTSTTYERYEANLFAEEYDFALVSPFGFVELGSDAYVPLGRPPGEGRAQFFVLESSALETVKDLKGKTVAVGPAGSAVEVLTVYTLREEGLGLEGDVNLRYFQSPLSCLQQLPAGTASACATQWVARERFAEQMNMRVKVIGESVAIPFGPMVAHRRVPEAQRDTIRDLLMAWRDDPRNYLDVSGSQFPSLVPVAPGDYELVREIRRAVQDR